MNDWWQLEAGASAVIAVGYFCIFVLIAVPTAQARQIRSNKLATATAAIFFSCAVGHGFHCAEALRSGLFGGSAGSGTMGAMPGMSSATGMAAPWWMAFWDTTTALVAVYYLTLRRSYGRLLVRAPLFDDLRERQRLFELEQLQSERTRATAAIEQARDAALAATVAKSAFLATMSHEIRTPMNAVIGVTDLLLDTPLDRRQQELVNTVRLSGDALLSVINDILDFSKIESGELQIEAQPFDIRDEVERCLDLVGAAASAKGLDVICYVEDSCPKKAVGDSVRLRQILLNLLSNAVKFTSTGEILMTVTAAGEDERLRLAVTVTDTGIGISEQGLVRLFDSFTQGDASTTRTYGGTGLGLAISKRLAQALGGDVSVSSTVGVGSTFTATVELDPCGDEDAADAGAPDLDLSGVSVLLVDDNLTCLRILDLQLSGLGAVCTTVPDPAAALEMVRGGYTYDVAIIDMCMPGMNGVELAQALRTVPAVAAAPMVLLTSVGSRPADSADTFEVYLPKPVKSATLHDALCSALSGHVVPAGRRPAASAPDKDRANAIDPMPEPLRILLAEDNVVNQRVAQLMLDKLGHVVVTVGNGAEAVEEARSGRFDVVLMDIQMPRLDGLAATRRIRAELPPDRQPYIVAMTANAMVEERRASTGAGMQAYLAKPVRVQDLRAVLEKAADVVRGGAGAAGTSPVALTGSTAASAHGSDATDGEGSVSVHRAAAGLASVDEDVLDELMEQMGDTTGALLGELVSDYLGVGSGQITRFASAARFGDRTTVERVAHGLRSTSALLGADRLAALLEYAEEQARAGTADLEPLAEPVEQEYAVVTRLLRPRVTAAKGAKGTGSLVG